jgi:spore germination protein GerM
VRRSKLVPLLILVAALVLVVVAVVRMTGNRAEQPPAVAVEPAGQVAVEEQEESAETAPMRLLNVSIYFPSAERDGLVGEPHEIFMTSAPGDRAKQILADLISGPVREQGLRALPPGTRLRQVYVLEQGTAYVDFSADLRQGLGGGSTEELFTVYAIVNSVALNIPEIRRVGILVNGEPVETLNGHLDLRRPLSPDVSLISRSDDPGIV